MRNILKAFGLLAILTIVFSNLTGCSTAPKNAAGENNAISETATTAAANGTAKTSRSSEYPPAPEAVLQGEVKNLDGSVFKVADLKGKVILLNLWATWCGPCRQEMPELVAMQNDFRDKDFKIIGLNVDDESADDIKAFGEKMKLNYDLAWADEKMLSSLIKTSKQSGIPQSFLIDREGHLRGVFFSANAEVVAKLRETIENVTAE